MIKHCRNQFENTNSTHARAAGGSIGLRIASSPGLVKSSACATHWHLAKEQDPKLHGIEASRQEVLLFEATPEGSAEALRLQLPNKLEEDPPSTLNPKP